MVRVKVKYDWGDILRGFWIGVAVGVFFAIIICRGMG